MEQVRKCTHAQQARSPLTLTSHCLQHVLHVYNFIFCRSKNLIIHVSRRCPRYHSVIRHPDWQAFRCTKENRYLKNRLSAHLRLRSPPLNCSIFLVIEYISHSSKQPYIPCNLLSLSCCEQSWNLQAISDEYTFVQHFEQSYDKCASIPSNPPALCNWTTFHDNISKFVSSKHFAFINNRDVYCYTFEISTARDFLLRVQGCVSEKSW